MSFVMAIDELDSTYCQSPIRSVSSLQRGTSCRLSINTSPGHNVKSANSKNSKASHLLRDTQESPYLSGDKIKVKSRVTGKTLMYEREASFTSSFPLAANIYRANSDEFKNYKCKNKKNKKSVLTLPNEQAPKQQECTVSDTNDSELFNRVNNHELHKDKRIPMTKKKQGLSLKKGGSPTSQRFGMSTNSSSIEMLTHFAGDIKRIKKKKSSDRESSMYKAKAYDIWTMLRNMNRFQFRPSPPVSEDSIVTSKKKKKKFNKKTKYRNDGRIIEQQLNFSLANKSLLRFVHSRQEEEVQYISNFEIETLSPSNSFCHASSSGRVTVIDKNDPFEDLCKDFQERIQVIDTAKFRKLTENSTNCNQNTRSSKKSPKSKKKVALKKSPQVKMSSQVKEKPSPINFDFPFPVNKIHSNTISKVTLNSEKNGASDSKNYFQPQSVDFLKLKTLVNNTRLASNQRNLTVAKKKDSEFELDGDSSDNISAITQVVLGKSKVNTPMPLKRSSSPPKRFLTRSITTNNLSTATGLNQSSDIKRRLAQFKFPITILGPNQVSSSYYVETSDPPQFEGLGDKIWPFMTVWYEDKNSKNTIEISNKVNKVLQYCWNKKTTPSAKQIDGTTKASLNSTAKQNISRRPITQLKDKMLKFLYKNSTTTTDKVIPTQNTDAETEGLLKYSGNLIVNSKQPLSLKTATTSNGNRRPMTLDNIIRHSNKNDNYLSIKSCTNGIPKVRANIKTSENPPSTKKPRYTWAKAQRASDFIENVISKIKSGVYCTEDNVFGTNQITEMNQSVDEALPEIINKSSSEKEIVGASYTEPLNLPSEEIYYQEIDSLRTIDGFDKSLHGLEVETLNNNRVAIKNCILNVLLHFDIAAPLGRQKRTTSIIAQKPISSNYAPITVTNNRTHILKCNTKIVNAILPAELCTILPNIMKNITMAPLPLRAMSALNTNKSQLSVITELSKGESYFFDTLLFTSTFELSPELKRLLYGRFSILSMQHKRREFASKTYFTDDVVFVRPTTLGCLSVLVDPFSLRICINVIPNNVRSSKNKIKTRLDTTCTALIPYVPLGHTISRGLQYANIYKVSSLLGSECAFTKEILFNDSTKKAIIKLTESIVRNTYEETKNNKNSECRALIKYSKPIRVELYERMEQANIAVKKNIKSSVTKNKKKGFIRRFRKCKSTSNLAGVRCSTTALSKITNLEELFLALGPGNSLCSVFDEMAESKILKSLKEMKKWIREITPRQILLVLLLMNKKDTQNLIKLRPVILQAIATNRITRSSELDIEVEVIEKERFNKICQYDDISYLPASFRNNDNILEELSWIAKATASDYQKPFDESSERLLKSLVERRKKLNPSYLRVMARYVGLGLLKAPK